jgi:hypothetical protein
MDGSIYLSRTMAGICHLFHHIVSQIFQPIAAFTRSYSRCDVCEKKKYLLNLLPGGFLLYGPIPSYLSRSIWHANARMDQ